MKYYYPNAEPYLLNRDLFIPHVITEVDDAYRIFSAHGFSWGGNWSNPKDYQHFEKLTSDLSKKGDLAHETARFGK